jgi:uncharacterized protein YdcH (DUF465 family)
MPEHFTTGPNNQHRTPGGGALMSSTVPETELQEKLLRDNAEYRRLAEEHQSYDQQLEDLASKHFLSEEEQIQERLLKKKKLLLKDQMYIMMQKIKIEMGES